ncbi:hypothetical protein T492DRAFT_283721 [Pavlovales sp. CCMP2436]|nr:hypothetical protein T492DRAFT_283721 [Pavlovales sp. CCMP2436]
MSEGRTPLLDSATGALLPACVAALGRCFRCCDQDADGALSERELRRLHIAAFGCDLAPDELTALLRLVGMHLPEGVRLPEGGRGGVLLLPGLCFLVALLLERGEQVRATPPPR